MRKIIFVLVFMSGFLQIEAENGYRLWLRYDLISNLKILGEYKNSINGLMFSGSSPTIEAAKEEMQIGLSGLLEKNIPEVNSVNESGIIIIGTPDNLPEELKSGTKERLKNIGGEGFVIYNSSIGGKKVIVVSGKKDIGLLYGVFNFLRLLQTNQRIDNLEIESSPKIKNRIRLILNFLL